MPELVWLPEALDDLRRLFDFLKDKNPDAASRAAQAIRRGADSLAAFPYSGRPMGDGTGRRERFVSFGTGSYVLRYALDDRRPVILRVWHSREQREPDNPENIAP
jgi:plasmid stabilization system protein ParE